MMWRKENEKKELITTILMREEEGGVPISVKKGKVVEKERNTLPTRREYIFMEETFSGEFQFHRHKKGEERRDLLLWPCKDRGERGRGHCRIISTEGGGKNWNLTSSG